jgi:hypothetical protein
MFQSTSSREFAGGGEAEGEEGGGVDATDGADGTEGSDGIAGIEEDEVSIESLVAAGV